MIAVANADAGLILRCQADDAAAFNEIVARYKNKVYNYVSRMVGSGADAEDLTQDVFVKAYLNIKSFQSRASLNTWLFRIATNICIDFRRKHAKAKFLSSSLQREDVDDETDSERDIPDERFDPQRLALNHELGIRLDSAMRALPDKLRTVAVLHDIEGLAYEEIAGVLDCPLGTVKSRLFHARMSLRRALGPYVNGSLQSPGTMGGRG